ncbi:MAG: acyl-CoA dehydrogenase family protein, partial [Deltaproteobacteria bacterium]|nr:acyl-CoA dehydrogenase family protein [Deltaproteobacteria bacterium]
MIAAINPDLKPFEDMATTFATKELAPNREENDRYPFGEFFNNVLDKAYEVGFLGITLPEDIDGIGQGISALCVILDNICQVDASLGGIILANAIAQEIMLSANSKDLLG